MENTLTNPSTGSTSSLQATSGRASARDFFLHLGAIVALYTVVISFLNLVFKIINKAYPEIANYSYYYGYGGSEISMPVATLIIVFPIFILLSYFVYKSYEENPAKKELGIRKWLTYITLFVAGIILVGDLVTVLYKFLDGQNLTLAFLLKALAVIIVTGLVFGFYLQDIRDRVSTSARKMWAIGVGLVIIVSIILGFSVLGSPMNQRLYRYDNQKVSDLQTMQYDLINNWQVYGVLPDTLDRVFTDPQSNTPYTYKKTGEISFELCAEFNKESMMDPNQPRMMGSTYPEKIGMYQNENWEHPMGRHCFPRTIDPIFYPTNVRG